MMCEPEIHMPAAIFVNDVRFMKQWNASLIFKLLVSMMEIIEDQCIWIGNICFPIDSK